MASTPVNVVCVQNYVMYLGTCTSTRNITLLYSQELILSFMYSSLYRYIRTAYVLSPFLRVFSSNFTSFDMCVYVYVMDEYTCYK